MLENQTLLKAATIAKVQQLPEALLQEVDDFIDFLITKRGAELSYADEQETVELAESDFATYLPELEDYEERLARGEVKW